MRHVWTTAVTTEESCRKVQIPGGNCWNESLRNVGWRPEAVRDVGRIN